MALLWMSLILSTHSREVCWHWKPSQVPPPPGPVPLVFKTCWNWRNWLICGDSMLALRLALRQALSLPIRVVSPSTPLPLFETKTLNNRAVIIISRMSSWSTVSSGPKEQRMIWVDCEMTGLDITKDKLIEIAVVVTDKDLNILAQGKEHVKAQLHVMSARNLDQAF